MNAKSLVKLINSSCEVALYDSKAEILMNDLKSLIENLIDNGKYEQFVDFSSIGIDLVHIAEDFNSFKLNPDLAFVTKKGASIDDSWKNKKETLQFEIFLETSELFTSNICGFAGNDIKKLSPFVSAIRRKGFDVHADPDGHKLLLIFYNVL